MRSAAIDVDISFGCRKWRGRKVFAALARRAIEAAAAGKADGSVAVRFTSDLEVSIVNRRWRALDKPTNVLSFPAAPGSEFPGGRAFLGDVVLAYETVAAEAAAEGKSLADHAAHLIIHGFLHLLGYDHAALKQAAAMERLEVKILARLGIANPYAAAAP